MYFTLSSAHLELCLSLELSNPHGLFLSVTNPYILILSVQRITTCWTQKCLFMCNTHKINITSQQNFQKRISRLVNEHTISSFQKLLNKEIWKQVYNSTCTNEAFNKFQEIFLRHYEATFPVKYTTCRSKQNNWIMKGIRISC